MSSISIPSEVLATLRSPTTRVRIGLWLAPYAQLEAIGEESARLGVMAVDLRTPILDGLRPGQRFLGLDVERFLQAIDEIAHARLAQDCRLIYHVDLLLARFTQAQRNQIWRQLYEGMPHRPYPLLIVMPQQAGHLLPRLEEQDAWRSEGRLAYT